MENEGKKSNFDVLSLVFGILSVVGIFSISFGALAIFFGVKQNKIEKNSLSKAGLILGIIGIVIRILTPIIIFIVYVLYILLVISVLI